MKLMVLFKISVLMLVFYGWGVGTLTAHETNKIPDLKEKLLIEVLDEISREHQVFFTYDSDIIKGVKVDYEKREGESVHSILSRVLAEVNMDFKIFEERFVILYSKDEAGLQSLEQMISHMEELVKDRKELFANRRVPAVARLSSDKWSDVNRKRLVLNVTGRVMDANGQSLIGVNIQVKGSNKGTSTDIDGRFSLNDIDDQAILVLSYIGYKSQEVEVIGQTSLTIVMQEDAQTLDEVIVVGYGTQKKVNLTGAVSEVAAERLENRSFSNMDQTLQGVSPGLNFTSNSSLGGEPNAKMNINIRGVGSLSGGSPFVLVDGSPMDINAVNPSDVESVSVLKDAASTAIYGSRAAYGVILITTKQGRFDEKLNINYTNNFSIAQPTFLPGFVNSLRFANTINEAATNSGQNAIFAESTIDRIIQYQKDPINTPSMDPNPSDPNGWGYWNQGHANTDWWDVLFKDNVFSQKHNLGVSGGSNNVNYYIGLGWLDEAGKFNFADEDFKRINLTSNIEIKASEKISFSIRSKYNRNFQRFHNSQSTTDRTALFSSMAISWPTDPVYTPNGDFALDKNQPPILANGGNDEQKTTDLWLNPEVQIKLTDDWNLNGNISYNYFGYERTIHRAIISGLAPDGITIIPHYSQNWNRLSHELTYNEYFTSNVYTDYEKFINKHFFNILLGGQAESVNNKLVSGWRRDLVTDQVPSISTAIGDKDIRDDISHWSTLGAFARFSYNYNEKYLFELNGRYDGSSRFQSGRRWGFFPSVAIGYNIWKEKFWEPISSVVNTLKLRASYGSLGNQNVSNYLYVETIPINTNLPWIINGNRPIYATVPSNRSTGLTWETANTINFGFDSELLNNRLAITIDIYKRKTENMFGPGESLPAIYGAAVPLKNNATLETKGVELSASWKQYVNQDFDFDFGIVLSDNKSIVTQYNNPTNYIGNFYEGQVYGDIWGYETFGIFSTDAEAENWVDQTELYSKWGAGDVKYTDIDGDGKISRGKETLGNSGDLKVIGNNQPRYMFGINANARYKSFGFSMFWQGVGKREIWLENQEFFGFRQSWTATTVHAHALDYWSTNNQDAYFARPYLTRENFKNQQVQSRFIQDASYIRLKNVQFTYSLPTSLTNRIGVGKVNIYLSGDNILTMSNMVGSFDPEANLRSPGGTMLYPLSRVFSAGLNLNF